MKKLKIDNYTLEIDKNLHTICNKEEKVLLVGYAKLGYFDLVLKINFVKIFDDVAVNIEYLGSKQQADDKFNLSFFVKDNTIKIKLNDYKENIWHL